MGMNLEPKSCTIIGKSEILQKKKSIIPTWEQNYSVFGKWRWRIRVLIFWKCRSSFQIPFTWYAKTQGLGWLEKSDVVGY